MRKAVTLVVLVGLVTLALFFVRETVDAREGFPTIIPGFMAIGSFIASGLVIFLWLLAARVLKWAGIALAITACIAGLLLLDEDLSSGRFVLLAAVSGVVLSATWWKPPSDQPRTR